MSGDSRQNMVFYRKYRPQNISELDNAKLRETLYSIFRKEEIPHAFLFTGPKGLGKTSTARIIAKIINCEHREQSNGMIEPCNTCVSCVSITKGNNIDVLEIDGASNRGIDEIRDLREKARLAPSNARKKVYIIDEVHMLTTEAFNALLKTIEEPPSHVVFIFATTEPQKVPATIMSRCFHVALQPATQEELIRAFKRIASGEELDIDEDVLVEIARLAEGGFRDGTKILEEIILLAKDKHITKGLVDSIYKTSTITEALDTMIKILEQHDTKKGLQTLSMLASSGVDMKVFLTQLIQKMHHILMIHMEIEKGEKISLTTEEISVLIQLLTKAYQDIKYAVVPQLPLEMLVITWSSIGGKYEVKNSPEKNGKPTIQSLIKKQQNLKVQSILGKEAVAPVVKPEHTIKQPEIPKNPDAYPSLMENLIYRVQSSNPSIAGLLRGCKLLSLSDTIVVFETPYKFHKEKLDDTKNHDILAKLIKELTGKTVTINITMKEGSK